MATASFWSICNLGRLRYECSLPLKVGDCCVEIWRNHGSLSLACRLTVRRRSGKAFAANVVYSGTATVYRQLGHRRSA